jgi:hypothetical protein
MKKIFLMIPLLAAIAGCSNKAKDVPELHVPAPSDIALQATEDFFQLNVDILESTPDKTSKVKQYTTVYQDNTCYIGVDSETLKVVSMSCQKVKSPQDKLLDETLTPKGKQAFQKLASGY